MHTEIESGLNRSAPILKALPRRAIDQIHAGTQSGHGGGVDAGGHVGWRVRAVERRQHVRHG